MASWESPRQAPPRKSWARRHRLRIALGAVALAMIAGGVLHALPSAGAPPDYRTDHAALVSAVENRGAAAEGAAVTAGDCAAAAGGYQCVLDFADQMTAIYRVTLSADGKTLTAALQG
jgi:hypothetical protein